jgi:hypothetical protein
MLICDETASRNVTSGPAHNEVADAECSDNAVNVQAYLYISVCMVYGSLNYWLGILPVFIEDVVNVDRVSKHCGLARGQ